VSRKRSSGWRACDPCCSSCTGVSLSGPALVKECRSTADIMAEREGTDKASVEATRKGYDEALTLHEQGRGHPFTMATKTNQQQPTTAWSCRASPSERLGASRLVHFIVARTSSTSVLGRTTRTPLPDRKCLMLSLTRMRAPAPIAAGRIGTSFAAASARARCAVGRWIWTGTARRAPSRAAPLQSAWRPDSVEPPPRPPRGARDEGGPARREPGSRGWHPSADQNFSIDANRQRLSY
jgi:hypothetical protein